MCLGIVTIELESRIAQKFDPYEGIETPNYLIKIKTMFIVKLNHLYTSKSRVSILHARLRLLPTRVFVPAEKRVCVEETQCLCTDLPTHANKVTGVRSDRAVLALEPCPAIRMYRAARRRIECGIESVGVDLSA